MSTSAFKAANRGNVSEDAGRDLFEEYKLSSEQANVVYIRKGAIAI